MKLVDQAVKFGGLMTSTWLVIFIGSSTKRVESQRIKVVSRSNQSEAHRLDLTQQERLEHLEQQCWKLFPVAKRDAATVEIDPHVRGFALDLHHNLSFCWNYKVASTSLASLMINLHNASDAIPTTKYHRFLGGFRPPSWGALQDYITSDGFFFLVVRHPFSRLVSAFRDRFQRNNDSFQARKFAPLIRKNLHRPNHEPNPPGLEFGQFVRYLLATPSSHYDPHWLPFWLHCFPCQLAQSPRAIVKVETLREDFEHLQTMVPSLRHLTMDHLHATRRGLGGTESHSSDYAIVKEHLEQISEAERYALYQIYQQDFLLFDYDPNFFVHS